MGIFRRQRAAQGRVFSARNERAVTASAQRASAQKAGGLKRLSQPWQSRSMSYYDLLGEAWFSAQFYARSLKQIRFFPALKDDKGEVVEIETGPVNEAWNRIQGPSGGTEEIQEQYGRLRFLTGEGYLLASGGEDDVEVWEFVSPDELRVDGDGNYRRYTAPGGKPQELDNVGDEEFTELGPGEAVAYRMWRRHPRFSALADAPMHGVLDLFEELMLLQMAVRARVKSRLSSSGLLVLNDSVTFAPVDGQADDTDPMNDVFVQQLIKHMTAPIGDEGTAAAVVPHVIRLPNPQNLNLDALIKHIKLHDPNETYRETGLRKECIERIAIGLDMPVEILLGLGDANHWSGWLIDEQVAKVHVFPVADDFANDIASAYLRPAAKEAGEKDWRQVVVGYDPAELVVHPDRGENAKEAFDRRAIGYPALRGALGFDDDDAATEEDLALMDTIDGPGQPEEPPPADNSTDEEPPDDEEEGATASAVASPRYERIMGAAEFAVHRGRELAGARLRSRLKTSAPDVANDLLAHTLGSERVNGSAAALVMGAAASFASAATRWGLPDAQLSRLGELIEEHAAATLLDAEVPPLPSSFTALLARVERETR